MVWRLCREQIVARRSWRGDADQDGVIGVEAGVVLDIVESEGQIALGALEMLKCIHSHALTTLAQGSKVTS